MKRDLTWGLLILSQITLFCVFGSRNRGCPAGTFILEFTRLLYSGGVKYTGGVLT